MMQRMLPRATTPAPGQNLLIPPLQIQTAMDLHQQVHKHRHKQGAGQDVRTDHVQAEIGEEDEGEAFGDGEAVGDLRMDFRVAVVRFVERREEAQAVEGEVQEEEEGVVDQEGEDQLEGEAARGWDGRGQGAG